LVNLVIRLTDLVSAKGNTKVSWYQYRFRASSDNVSIYWYNIVILQASHIRNTKTTISQHYTSFVFPFAETRSWMWLCWPRE